MTINAGPIDTAGLQLISASGNMACPACEFEFTHLTDVVVGGRAGEDGDIVAVQVTSAGEMRSIGESGLPVRPARRHVFSLSGWCEGCGGTFTVSFEQHKGETKVTASHVPNDSDMLPDLPV